MKKLLFKTILVAAAMCVGTSAWAEATVQNFGSASAKTWTYTSSMANIAPTSTVTLDGVVMTFGNATGVAYQWDYHSDNKGLICSMTPSNDGTNYVSSWKITDNIPSYGCVFKFVPSADGVLTVKWLEATSTVYFVEVNGVTKTILRNSNGPGGKVEQTYQAKIYTGRTYYLFQLGGGIASGRCTLRSLEYAKTSDLTIPTVSGYHSWNFVEESATWWKRIEGVYDGLAIIGNVSWDSSSYRYMVAANDDGTFQFKVNTTGYLVIHGKSNNVSYGMSVTIGETTTNNRLKTTTGSVYCQKVTTSTETLIKISAGDARADLFGIYWIPSGSDEDTKTKSVTLDTKGFATYRPAYTVSIPSGLNAYYLTAVNASEGTITPSSALETKIPAGTAVILVGECGETYNFNAYGMGSHYGAYSVNSASGTINTLRGVYKSGTTLAGSTGSVDYYAYKKNAGCFAKVTADLTIPEGLCYFTTAKSAGAREFRLVFDEETTGVADVRSKMTDVRGEYYNLSGQRVAAPTKGLYIVGGKKIIMK